MTALANTIGSKKQQNIKRLFLALASGVTIWPGSSMFWDVVAGKVTNAVVAASNLIFLGEFTGNVKGNPVGKFVGDGTTRVEVDLEEELLLVYFTNGTGGDAIGATNFLQKAYGLDDATASILPAGKPLLGTIWDIDANGRIGVLKANAATAGLAATPTLAAFAAGALAPATLQNGAVYDVPLTAAASTITLPAAAPDGTEVEFSADGTKNGNTVQYVDATGPVNLTTALTASKRHLVRCVKLNGTWRANAYVGP